MALSHGGAAHAHHLHLLLLGTHLILSLLHLLAHGLLRGDLRGKHIVHSFAHLDHEEGRAGEETDVECHLRGWATLQVRGRVLFPLLSYEATRGSIARLLYRRRALLLFIRLVSSHCGFLSPLALGELFL